jgi:hypothetical protein
MRISGSTSLDVVLVGMTTTPPLPSPTAPAKRAASAGQIRLTAPTEQPHQELIKMLGSGAYFVQPRDLAGFTPPVLTT